MFKALPVRVEGPRINNRRSDVEVWYGPAFSNLPPQKGGSLLHITVGSRVIFATVGRHVCAGKAGRARGYYYVGLMIAYVCA